MQWARKSQFWAWTGKPLSYSMILKQIFTYVSFKQFKNLFNVFEVVYVFLLLTYVSTV